MFGILRNVRSNFGDLFVDTNWQQMLSIDFFTGSKAGPTTSIRERSVKDPCTYILASKPDGILYVGVTSDIWGRMSEHKQGIFTGFTKRYDVKMLVYYEFNIGMDEAITREKRIKEWRRAWKIRLILSVNPQWLDLFDEPTNSLLNLPNDELRTR
jgi:putative endonuclease